MLRLRMCWRVENTEFRVLACFYTIRALQNTRTDLPLLLVLAERKEILAPSTEDYRKQNLEKDAGPWACERY